MSTQEDFDFLDFDDICAIHDDQLSRYGGSPGINDANVIHSSIAQARWALARQLDVADMAAAYLYHFAMNQGFVDGNKRTAVVAAVEFLARNGYILDGADLEMYDLAMRVANKLMEKEAAADWLRERIAPMP